MDDLKELQEKTERLKKSYPEMAMVLDSVVSMVISQRKAVDALKAMVLSNLVCRMCKKTAWDSLSEQYIQDFGFCDRCDKIMSDAGVESS